MGIINFPPPIRSKVAPPLDGARLAFSSGFPVIEFGDGNRRFLDEVPMPVVQRMIAAYAVARRARDFPHGNRHG